MSREFLKKPKQLLYAALCLFCVGMAILLIPNGRGAAGGQEASAEQETLADAAAYAHEMEQRLSELLSSVEGAGQVQVMVTLESGESYLYAQDAVQTAAYDSTAGGANSVLEQSVILMETESGDAPLIVTKQLPKILGVAVICDGGDDIYVKQSMMEAVSILCGISTSRISVCKRAATP